MPGELHGCASCRAAGEKLFLKGERCFSPKCAITRRNYGPGQHGAKGKRKSEYGVQLSEKQKVKDIYGIRERQFRNYFERAIRKEGVTGDVMLATLERRIDNIVYRLGFGSSRREARQLVSHKHFAVNGTLVNIPSQELKVGDVLTVKPSTLKTQAFQDRMKKIDQKSLPKWVEFDAAKGEAKILALPEAKDIDHQPQMQLIIEFYSR